MEKSGLFPKGDIILLLVGENRSPLDFGKVGEFEGKENILSLSVR